MTDTRALPPPESEPEPPPPAPRARREWMPLAYLVGFLVLASALVYLWRNPALPPPQAAVDPAVVDQLRQEVAGLDQRIARLEQRPAPATTDLQPLEKRLTALEQRPQPEAPPPVDLKPIEDRIKPLEDQIKPLQEQIKPLQDRLAADEAKLTPDAATHGDLTTLSARVDAIATRQDQLAARQQGLETGFGNRMDRFDEQLGSVQSQAQPLLKLPDQLHAMDDRLSTVQSQAQPLLKLPDQISTMDQRLGTTEKQAGQVASVADRAARIARIQAAQTALDAGQPLGKIPSAPPALARFAEAAPPTEADLRLSFCAAAKQAELASIPSIEGKPLLDRLWTRAQTLVTLREGDHVIVGDPAAGIIARARQALVAGDLHGAVAALNELNGPAAEAMAPWKGRAQQLLDARAALANLAANA